MNTTRRLILALCSVLALGLAGCKGATPIGDLLADPTSHDRQVVRIKGTVGEAVGALGYGAYRLDDGTGSILVVTQTSGAPRSGAEVAVEGEFRSAFTLGTESLAAVVEKQRKLVKS